MSMRKNKITSILTMVGAFALAIAITGCRACCH